jgi:hypothetical protein
VISPFFSCSACTGIFTELNEPRDRPSTLSAIDFVNALCGRGRTLDPGEQDAHELYQYVATALAEELDRVQSFRRGLSDPDIFASVPAAAANGNAGKDLKFSAAVRVPSSGEGGISASALDAKLAMVKELLEHTDSSPGSRLDPAPVGLDSRDGFLGEADASSTKDVADEREVRENGAFAKQDAGASRATKIPASNSAIARATTEMEPTQGQAATGSDVEALREERDGEIQAAESPGPTSSGVRNGGSKIKDLPVSDPTARWMRPIPPIRGLMVADMACTVCKRAWPLNGMATDCWTMAIPPMVSKKKKKETKGMENVGRCLTFRRIFFFSPPQRTTTLTQVMSSSTQPEPIEDVFCPRCTVTAMAANPSVDPDVKKEAVKVLRQGRVEEEDVVSCKLIFSPSFLFGGAPSELQVIRLFLYGNFFLFPQERFRAPKHRSPCIRALRNLISPPCLVLHLARAQSSGKRQTSVSLRPTFNDYEVVAVVEHLGQLAGTGHYVCWRRAPVGSGWVKANDASVRAVEWGDVVASGGAYMVFLDKGRQRGAPLLADAVVTAEILAAQEAGGGSQFLLCVP